MSCCKCGALYDVLIVGGHATSFQLQIKNLKNDETVFYPLGRSSVPPTDWSFLGWAYVTSAIKANHNGQLFLISTSGVDRFNDIYSGKGSAVYHSIYKYSTNEFLNVESDIDSGVFTKNILRYGAWDYWCEKGICPPKDDKGNYNEDWYAKERLTDKIIFGFTADDIERKVREHFKKV